MPYAQVVVNVPIRHAFTYHIPKELENLQPGMRVFIPFGKQMITGIVVNLLDKSPYSSCKDIIDVLDDKPLISQELLQLTKWVADYYFSSWGQAVQLALPKGIDKREKEIVHLAKEDPHIELSERQKELYLLIGDHPDCSKDFLRKKFGTGSFYYLLNRLEEQGLITREKQIEGARVGQLLRKFVQIPQDYVERKKQHEDFLKYLRRRPEVDAYLMERAGQRISMTQFLKETRMSSPTLQKMHGYDVVTIREEAVEREPNFSPSEEENHLVLTPEQHDIVKEIGEELTNDIFKVYLLHGITGSGKTQVYIEALKKVLRRGKSGIILIPEIALTPQTVRRFKAVFTEKIAVFHSKMSPGERYDAWMACYEGRAKIVVGPRSALFAPLQNLGLVVVDEEHESTYKQTDTIPRYNARDTAVFRARQNNALVILGSATPSLESYYNTRRGKYILKEMNERVDNLSLPDVHLVDMKTAANRVKPDISLFSKLLSEKIENRLAKKEQIILLQNRRGYSSFLQCKNCGFIPVCPNCDVSLTYHSYSEKLQCHLCGHKQPAFFDCPNCGGEQIVYKGSGTQRIQKQLNELFPHARILRMDQDTTRGKNQHDTILNAFGNKEADILLGTQMIAKGLDFSNVTLVGVISADVGLALPDFRAAERVFQLLTQVAGRAGRGMKGGEVVVQSYLYSHYAIQLAKNHNYNGFYDQEIHFRKEYKYPPFLKIIQLVFMAQKTSEVIHEARLFALNLNKMAKPFCQVVGPSPAIIPRMKNRYRWQLLLKLNPQTDPTGKKTKNILENLITPQRGSRKSSVQIIVDVDPLALS
ncbi:MAG TPA: primosomal protein N' [Calditrichaeota bacterium]|nr:primosomal protein N' [Calditrichota bacterium]